MKKEQNGKRYGKIVFPGLKNNVIDDHTSISFIEGDGHYVDIYFKEASKMTQAVCLKFLEDRLDPALFFRSHKTYIVNLKFLKKCHKQSNCCVLTTFDDNQIPMSTRRCRILKNRAWCKLTSAGLSGNCTSCALVNRCKILFAACNSYTIFALEFFNCSLKEFYCRKENF